MNKKSELAPKDWDRKYVDGFTRKEHIKISKERRKIDDKIFDPKTDKQLLIDSVDQMVIYLYGTPLSEIKKIKTKKELSNWVGDLLQASFSPNLFSFITYANEHLAINEDGTHIISSCVD